MTNSNRRSLACRNSRARSLRVEQLEDRTLLAVLSVGPSGTFATIQSAIDNARPDDVVEIADGVYDEAIDLSRMGSAVSGQPADLILRGESTNAILRAPTGSAIFNSSSITAEFRIEGFTIESPTEAASSNGINLTNVTGTIDVLGMTFQNIAASALSLDMITGDIALRENQFQGTGGTDGTNALLVRDLDGRGVIALNQMDDVLGTAMRIVQSEGTETLLLVSENTIRGDASFLSTTQNGIVGSVSGTARLDLSLHRNKLENLGGHGISLLTSGQAETQTTWTTNLISQLNGDAAFLVTVTGNSNTAFGAVNNSVLDAANDGLRIVLADAANLAASIEGNLFLVIGADATDAGLRLSTSDVASGQVAASIRNNDFDTIGGDGLVLEPRAAVDATFAIVDNFFTGTNSIGGDAAVVIGNADTNATNAIQAVIAGNQLVDGVADAYRLEQQGGTLAIEGDAASASQEIAATNTGSGIEVIGTVTLLPLGSLAPATPRLLGDFVWADDNGDGLQDAGESGIELVQLTLTGSEQLGGAAITRQTLTNNEGAYLFSAVLPGAYTISLEPVSGFVPTEPLVGDDRLIDSDFDAVTATVQLTLVDSNDLSLDAGLVAGFPWQNSNNVLDVNADSSVSPIDVLQIINELNSFGAHALLFPTNGNAPPPFFDVNGDNVVSPIDALQIINFLNNAAAEGEAISLDLDGIVSAEASGSGGLHRARKVAEPLQKTPFAQSRRYDGQRRDQLEPKEQRIPAKLVAADDETELLLTLLAVDLLRD